MAKSNETYLTHIVFLAVMICQERPSHPDTIVMGHDTGPGTSPIAQLFTCVSAFALIISARELSFVLFYSLHHSPRRPLCSHRARLNVVLSLRHVPLHRDVRSSRRYPLHHLPSLAEQHAILWSQTDSVLRLLHVVPWKTRRMSWWRGLG